jgi:hypothetical protein
MIINNKAIKKAPISWDSFASVERSFRLSLFSQRDDFMLSQILNLSSSKSSGAAGGTCTRTVALTKATVYYMTFGGMRPPEQYYLNTYEY